jgi:hypothetical protein
MMMTTMMMKQIHLFFRAARAESTAFSVYCKLRQRFRGGRPD